MDAIFGITLTRSMTVLHDKTHSYVELWFVEMRFGH